MWPEVCLDGFVARAAASRRLLQGEEAGALNDPNPICQFCEVAVSYVKVSHCSMSMHNVKLLADIAAARIRVGLGFLAVMGNTGLPSYRLPFL